MRVFKPGELSKTPKREQRSDIHGNPYYVWTCMLDVHAHHTRRSASECNKLNASLFSDSEAKR